MRIVEIEDLHVSFRHHDGTVHAVRGVSLGLNAGESLGIVGESGSGKSVTFMALMQLLKPSSTKIVASKLNLAGSNMLSLRQRDLAMIRGATVAMVFQDPMTSFDPLFSIGDQIAETIRTHRSVAKREAFEQSQELLARVEIKNAGAVLKQYPHQLSSGMLQRAMIAMALSCEPSLLIADEPTTALDVTIQAQILQLITDLQAETGMSLIIITHDLGVVAETVDRVVVMYAGRVMETGGTVEIFEEPFHPYTQALLDSVPGRVPGKRKLNEIQGTSPNALSPPSGCPFHPRCKLADDKCAVDMPALLTSNTGRAIACWKVSS